MLNNGTALLAGGSGTLATAELYDPVAGTFTATSSPNAARMSHTATLLDNGMVLLACGNSGRHSGQNSGALSSTELYDPTSGTFILGGSANIARFSHTATLLGNGNVLIAGGTGSSGNILASAELYNSQVGTFSLNGSLNVARSSHTATLLDNGMVLIVGGYDFNHSSLASAELYDPSSGTFTLTGSLNVGRSEHTATLLNNGIVLIAGGYDINGNSLASAELYNPASGTFTLAGGLNSGRAEHTATLLNNGMVLVSGGLNTNSGTLASAELYDPVAGTFSVAGSMNSTRQDFTATLLNSWQVMITGGIDCCGHPLNSAELYQPSTLAQTGLSISVSPTSSTVPVGGSQTFAATGTFSDDNSTQTLTSVTWSSSDATIVTMANDASNRGAALAVGVGTATVSACEGSVCGSATITVVPAPNIGGLSPNSGVAGIFVTISGSGFGAAQGTSTVTFNGTVASPTSWTPDGTTIVVAVPPGASTGNVLVTVDGGPSNPAAFAVPTPNFAPSGILGTGRAFHTATLLDDGTVLLAGGAGSSLLGQGSYLSSAEVYDPVAGTFSAAADLNTARSNHTATLLNNGEVLIACGSGAFQSVRGFGFGPIANAELYDPASTTFAVTGSANTARTYHTATLLHNGKVLIAGGTGEGALRGLPVPVPLGNAELYDPATGTFTATGNMNATHSSHTATLLNNGKVLIAGGSDGNTDTTAELYDPSTGTFTLTGSLNIGRGEHTATLLNNGMVLIAGGFDINSNSVASAELYDPRAGTFTLTGNLNTGRADHTAILLNNGMVLVSGGFNTNNGTLATVELYDPVAGTFTVTGSMNSTREDQTTTLLNSGTALIAGGIDFYSNVLNSSELYQPSMLTLTPPGLESIAVTPNDPSVTVGTTQPFTATGTFTDNSTQTLASVTWASSDTRIAIIGNDSSNRGNAITGAAGLTTITACAGSVCGSSAMTVLPSINLNSYQARRAIVLNHAQVSNTDQINFPVLISGIFGYLANVAHGGMVQNQSGYDIVFSSDPEGANPLSFEIDSYDPMTGTASFWVSIPRLSHTVDTVIYMFYGNPNVTVSQENKVAVWLGYAGVWHFGNGTSLGTGDSTANGNNGNANGTNAASGKIGGAASFAGSSGSYIDVGNGISLNATAAVMVSAWVYPNSPGIDGGIFVKAGSPANGNYPNPTNGDYLMRYQSGGEWVAAVNNGSGWTWPISNNVLRLSSWTKLDMCWNGTQLLQYTNGTLDNAVPLTTTLTTNGLDATIGYNFVDNSGWVGAIDEVRVIADACQSSDWIATEYANQSAPSAFFTIEDQATANTAPTIEYLSPTAGTTGTVVTIQGAGFGTAQAGSTVTFNGTTAAPTGWNDASIVVPVPAGATTGSVVVTVGGVASNGVSFTVGTYNNGYQYRRAIVINHANVANTDQVDFPILISVSSFLAYGGSVQNSNGYDIIFSSDPEGTTKLDHEIDTYDAVSGNANFWVRIPTLSHTWDTVIYLFYGNSGITTSQENKSGVWRNNYAGVWHFGSNTSLSTSDSTANANNGTNYGVTPAAGMFGGAGSFDGTGNTYLRIPSSNSYKPSRAITLEAWVNMVAATSYPDIFSLDYRADGSWTSPYQAYALDFYSSTLEPRLDVAANGNQAAPNGPNSIATTQWTHVAGTYDGSNMIVYANGSSVVTQGQAGQISYGTSLDLDIGTRSPYTTAEAVYGLIDEARISVVARSADWIATEYANQSSPATFYTIEAQAAPSGAPTIEFLSPNTYPIGAPILIQGGGFQTTQGTSTVTFNGVTATPTSWNDASIIVPVPAGATNGNVIVTVNGVPSNGMPFTVLSGGPAIAGLSTNAAPVGATVTISGTNFGSNGSVTFNGATATTGNWGTGPIAATVPAGAPIGNGSVVVTVGGIPSPAVAFTVLPTPAISSLSPTSGGPGIPVTIQGTNFGVSQGSSSTVLFNGVPATSIISWNDNLIVADVPPAVLVGQGPVTVVINSVSSNTNILFTAYNPVISSLSPPAGAVGGTVTINGSGFGSNQGTTSSVSFDGTGTSIQSWSDTAIQVTVPPSSSGLVTVTVNGVTSPGAEFQVEALPVIYSLSQNSGQAGMYITISGNGFGQTQSDSTVTFSGVGASVTSWNDNEIGVVVPEAVPGRVTVTVAGLTAQGPNFFVNVQAALTNSLGYTTTYTSNYVSGKWLLMNAEGPGCSSCSIRNNVQYSYDSNGNVLSKIDANGNTTTYTYDPNTNNMLSQSALLNGAAVTTSYTYNSFGEVQTMTDPLNQMTTNTYDNSNGNLLSITTPAPDSQTPPSVTQFAYNTLGELTQITDPLGNSTSIQYNSVGLISSITDAKGNTTSYTYDARGNRTSVIDPVNGSAHPTIFKYDIMNRLLEIDYPNATSVSFTYDYRGRRITATDQNSRTTTYAYDDADRLLSVTDPANNVTQFGYDTESNLTSITDANDHTTTFTYDAFGRVVQTTFPSTLYEMYGYDPIGNLKSKTDRKNQTIQYVYDSLYRLTKKTYPDTSIATFVYDLVGKIQSVTDPSGTYTFVYDNMGRLTGTTTQYSSLPGYNVNYTYDAASNRTSMTADGSTNTYNYDTLNRLHSVTSSITGQFVFSYDDLSRRTQTHATQWY